MTTSNKSDGPAPGHTRMGMEVSHAAARAVQQCNVDVVAAYPITPQTHIVERLSELVANGEMNAEFVPVESEHSAMSVCVGSSATGARTFTCTSSQGLILMSEVVYITSAMRLPVVMILANRSLSGPLSIWADHSDVMSVRDCGWIQTFAENGQEVYDLTFHAYKVAENRDILHPIMLNLDGFHLTHVVEPIDICDQSIIDKYLPEYEPLFQLHPDKPVTMGAYGVPELFTEAKKNQDEALKAAYPHILEAWKEWGDLTGRYYKPVETYKAEGAKTLFLTMGSIGETASVAVDGMQERGEDVGLVKLRLWRPFPFDEVRKALAGADNVIVLDRALSFGGPGGPVSSEIRATLYGLDHAPTVYDYVVGLAGRDVKVDDFEKIANDVRSGKARKGQDEYVIYAARE
ncbi:MAG: pyruvate ferredoxin oxidoreductase [Deltaproteobacteria bacterium]|nr:pyruvate ferredoxin oxidoreductase [Deltaproteobacteria bacterium]